MTRVEFNKTYEGTDASGNKVILFFTFDEICKYYIVKSCIYSNKHMKIIERILYDIIDVENTLKRLKGSMYND